MLWEGMFEAVWSKWLRWTDEHGTMITTGRERADEEHRRAEHVEQLLAKERQHAEQERPRAERLAALLRRSGIDPEQK